MADTLGATGAMELSMKDNGIIVDLTPAALLHHSSMVAHSHAFRSIKETNADDSNITAQDNVVNNNNNSVSPTNLSTSSSPPMTTFRCERCENFETNSRASLLLHVVQCLSSPARLKLEDTEPENMSVHVVDPTGGMGGKLKTETPSIGLANAVVSNGSASAGNHAASASSSSSTTSSSSTRKVFECDVCNMKFSNGANMRRHKMRHTGVKPYECRVCQKRFFRKDHLAEHFTTHTKTLPYHCPICNRGFQRQIAMRAHFQNEHVGQHDLVKTCPLCSYRAGSMKSLRIHFFNRHGIDLDNPGPGGTSSLLLALESQASQVAAAAAAAGFVPGLNAVAAAAAAANINMPSHQSDSGESIRSMDNATPPMHFLTPHVEISTLSENGTELFNGNNSAVMNASMGGCETNDAKGNNKERSVRIQSPVPAVNVAAQDQPMDCNAKSTSMPSSTSNNAHNGKSHNNHHHHHHHQQHHHHENHITPSISLIPIKQEPLSEEQTQNEINKNGLKDSINGDGGSDSEFSTPNNRVTSLIKVSPLKSLLREDLKRRICAKANNRITRNAAALENNNVIIQNPTAATPPNSSSCNSTPICNGTITSTGQETDALLLNRKQILTCHFCGIEFPDETLYFLHKGCHCESNPWKCNICGEQCNNVYEFNSHLLSKSHQ